jgi:hypothetical protein
MKKYFYFSVALGVLTSISMLLTTSKANAFTLLNVSEDYSSLDASYSWDGSQSDLSYSSDLTWWQFGSYPNPAGNGNTVFSFAHLPIIPGRYFPGQGSTVLWFIPSEILKVSFQYSGTTSVLCSINSSDVCNDTFNTKYQPNDNGFGGIFDITGDRVLSNVPEPLTVLGSGLAIAIGTLLKRRSKSLVS